jgi:hypothetical protein
MSEHDKHMEQEKHMARDEDDVVAHKRSMALNEDDGAEQLKKRHDDDDDDIEAHKRPMGA